MAKYGQQQSISESTTPCTLVVFEHFGFWGPMVKEYLNKIFKKLKDEHGRNNETVFQDRWRKQLSVAVQSFNSRVIFKKLSKLSKCNFDDFTYDRDIQHFVH